MYLWFRGKCETEGVTNLEVRATPEEWLRAPRTHGGGSPAAKGRERGSSHTQVTDRGAGVPHERPRGGCSARLQGSSTRP